MFSENGHWFGAECMQPGGETKEAQRRMDYALTNESVYCQQNLQEMETSERRYREKSSLMANYPKYSIEHSSNMVHNH